MPPSKSLITKREDVCRSSLMPLSGALLAWLEMIEENYSKKLLNEVVPLADEVIISFATRSMIRKEKFKANRKWILVFVKENFKILDEFEIGAERYVVFKCK